MVVQIDNRYKRKNEEGSESVPIKKKRLEFCVSSFRKRLRKAECYEALEEFVKACHGAKGKDDPAEQYLKEGGQLADFLKILDSKHDDDISHVSLVFSALQVIILRVLTKVPECRKSAEEICHHLLSNHLRNIHRLLSVKSSAHHKKVVLQLLTAVVTLNTTLARDVLSYVSFTTDVVDNIVRLIRPDDPKSVRICFIQFLLAFLVGGNSSVISLLLDKRLILTSIIRGLMYDPSDLVIFVITTFRTKLVEAAGINRTQKIHTFNTRVLSQLLSLYKWKGPAAFAHEKKNSSGVCPEVDLQQQQSVAEAVHALFLILCTSYRYGIVFHDRTLGTKSRMNVMVANVLKELDRPWENNLLTDLVVQIAGVRPELSPISYSRVVPVLEPRATKPWIMAVNFVTQILSALNLNELTSLEPQAALDTAKKLSASRHVVIPLTPGVMNEHPAVRHKTTVFLQALLNAVGVSLTALPEQQAVEFQLYVRKMIPSVDVLVKSWRRASKNFIPEKSPSGIEVPSPTDQMMALVDLMFLYQKHFPLLLDAGDNRGTLTKMLSSTLDVDDSDINNENTLSLQLKILKLLAQLDTGVLEPQKSGFVSAVSILLQASCKNDALAVEAQHTLGALLVKCQVLEPAAADMIGEMGVWLQNCQVVQPSLRPTLISFLQDVLVSVATNPVPYLEQILRVQETIFSSSELGKMKGTQVDQAENLFRELLEIANSEKSHFQDCGMNVEETEGKNKKEKEYIHDFAGSVSLSPLLMFIDSVKLKENLDACVMKYLSCVLVHLLHMQSDPRPFLSVVKNWSAIPNDVMDYINSWNTETPLVLTKPFGTCSLESSLSHVLLGQNKDIAALEDCSNPIRILQLLRMVVFYIVQFAERQQLTESMTSLALDVLLTLFRALQDALSHNESSISEKFNIKCVNLILRHSVLLCYFSPLHRRKQVIESLVTSFMLHFLEQITEVISPAIAKNSNVLLKDKLLRNILYYLERSKQAPTNTHMLLRAVKMLALTGPETCSLMPKLIEKMTIQPWTELICYLLRNVDCLPSEQVVSLGNKLVEHLQEDHDNTRSAAWEVADSFQYYLQQFPHCVRQVPSGLFRVSVCERGLELASVILHHQSSYVMELRTLVEQKKHLITSPKVLFPLLSKASCHGPLPSSLLKAVYEQYEGNLFEAMLPPFSATTCFSNHVDIIKLLIPCIDLDKCISLSQLITQNRKKLEICTSFHLNVIQSLQIQGGWKKLAVELIEILLHQLKQMLQMKEQTTLISQLCSLLGDHLIDNRVKWRKQKLQLDETWNTLPALVLQSGLSVLDHHLTCCLFLVFARLLWRANATIMAAQVFEMTVSHSRFLDIVLIQQHSDVKLAVLQLILTCYELAPHVIKPSQVPIWLGSYGATLSHCDQVTLKILCCMNNCQNVNLNAYRPFLWGEAAINHYSVRSRAGMSLWRVPQATVALELLQLKMVENTIAKFPLNRKLLLKDQEDLCESGNFISFIEDLEPNQPDIYDPAFLIPLLSHILAPESVVQEHKFSRFGGLAVTLAALASKCGYMRTAALSVLSRFHARLNPKSSNAQLNEQFIESIRAGIGNLKASEVCKTTKHDPKKNTLKTCDQSTKVDDNNASSRNDSNQQGTIAPVVPNLFAVFLARTSLVLTQPLHELFKPLNRYVLAKPALDLKSVPDLLELLRPDSVDFRAYQLWLIETLQFGMRTEEDVANAKGRHLFKMLFALYSSSLSDVRTRILILRLVEATLCVSNGSTLLLRSGILPWLHGIINSLEKEEDGDVIIAFIRVIVSLKDHALSFGRMVVPFLMKLPPVMKSSDIHCILQAGSALIKWMSQDHLVVLLCLCESVLDHKIIHECCAHLGLPEGSVIKNLEFVDNNDTCGRDLDIIVEDQKALGDSLKKVVHQWLTYKYEMKA